MFSEREGGRGERRERKGCLLREGRSVEERGEERGVC